MLDLLDKINNIYYIIMDKPKDKKKIKGGKSKKKMKQPKTSSDKKTIEALKKQLRIITEKYLNDRKTRTKDPEKFKVDSDRIKKKVNNANSPENISRLISMLSSGKSPSVITAPPQQQAPTIRSTRGTMSDRINTENLSKKYDELLNKWNNLDYSDEKKVREFYRDFKGFVENMADFGYETYQFVNRNWDTAKKIAGGVGGVVSSIYSYLVVNRPEGADPPNNPTDAPPAPPPPPPQTAPPPPPPQTAPPPPPPEPTPVPPEQTPEQTPTPTPTPPPTTEYLKDTLSSLVKPAAATALGLGALYGGGLIYRNRNRIRNDNAQVARQQERIQDIVVPLATGLAERAALGGLGGDMTGLFPPTERNEELNIESFLSRRNRDRTGLDSRLDIQQNIQNTQDSTEQAKKLLENNVEATIERIEKRLERQRVRDERRDKEMRRVQDELENPQNFRNRDNLRQLRQEVGIAQQEADINRQLQQQNINEDSIRSPNTREVREEAEQINRLFDDVRDMGEDTNLEDSIALSQRLPQVPTTTIQEPPT